MFTFCTRDPKHLIFYDGNYTGMEGFQFSMNCYLLIDGQLPPTRVGHSLKFLKKYGNLRTSFPDLEKV